ncbi:MAG: hypothetical protein ACI4LA_04725 [Emergencia sp.]
MNKETMLKKAFAHAMGNAALRFADHDIDFIIIKNDMTDFAAKNNMDLTEEEIVEYIKDEVKRIDEAVKDFTYQTRMMK